MTDVIRAYKRGRELFREGMEFSRVMTSPKAWPNTKPWSPLSWRETQRC